MKYVKQSNEGTQSVTTFDNISSRCLEVNISTKLQVTIWKDAVDML